MARKGWRDLQHRRSNQIIREDGGEQQRSAYGKGIWRRSMRSVVRYGEEHVGDGQDLEGREGEGRKGGRAGK